MRGRQPSRRADPATIGVALIFALAIALLPDVARADQEAPKPPAPEDTKERAVEAPAAPRDWESELRALRAPEGRYIHLFGAFEIGRGLRFNNPYRLATQLGSVPESVSLTATYADLSVSIALGDPNGAQHGASLHASFALHGVPQVVLTPSYLIAYRSPSRILAYGRLGPSIVLTPDPTFGLELAGGFGVFVTSRVAIASEIVFDAFYGAGSPSTGVTTYPVLSGQLGVLVDYEVLP